MFDIPMQTFCTPSEKTTGVIYPHKIEAMKLPKTVFCCSIELEMIKDCSKNFLTDHFMSACCRM